MKKVAFGLTLLFLLPVLVAGAAMGELHTGTAQPAALEDIPGQYARLYVHAASRFSFSWQLLAAVGKVECDHGRGDCYRPNEAGAMGPMQFMPGTWPAYKSASGAPPYSVYDARDAVFAAAAKLASDGVRRHPAAALYSYNHSTAYVDEVIGWALKYGWIPVDPALVARAVLESPNIELRPAARADVVEGLVDTRVLAALLDASLDHRLSSVGPFVSDHSLYVADTTRISNHAVGRAVDIPVVDGAPVSAGNAAARDVAESLLKLPPVLRPDELGSPWYIPTSGVVVFTKSHDDHIHLGYSS